jgi:hypothetical protein
VFPVNWVSVQSSHIDAIGWTAEGGGRLWVRFDGGKTGYYERCPQLMFVDMMRAPSKGQYKDRMLIKGGKKWVYATPPEVPGSGYDSLE